MGAWPIQMQSWGLLLRFEALEGSLVQSVLLIRRARICQAWVFHFRNLEEIYRLLRGFASESNIGTRQGELGGSVDSAAASSSCGV